MRSTQMIRQTDIVALRFFRPAHPWFFYCADVPVRWLYLSSAMQNVRARDCRLELAGDPLSPTNQSPERREQKAAVWSECQGTNAPTEDSGLNTSDWLRFGGKLKGCVTVALRGVTRRQSKPSPNRCVY